MNEPDHRIKGLGEVSVRVRDLAVTFYEDVVGLEVLRREESFVFFEIAVSRDRTVPEQPSADEAALA